MKRKTLLKILIGLVSVLIILVCLSFINSGRNFYEQLEIGKQVDSTLENDAKQKYLHQLTLRNREIRNNWNDFINFSPNEYNYFEIGGIENLQIVCTNNTEYEITEAVIDVCYIIDNGSCYKTEQLIFKNVPPNSRIVKNAPSSSRGKKVSLDVLEVYSDGMNFLYNITTPLPNGSNDPYFSISRNR